jgi:hypothetical protein
MSASPRVRVSARSSTVAVSALAVGLATLLSACSSTRQPDAPQVYSWVRGSEPPSQYAGTVTSQSVELEDDGLPSQASPSVRNRQMPADPNAPWSPNYGRTADGQDWGGEGFRPVASVTPDDGGDGYPVPKSPEEAGVHLPATEPENRRGGSYPPPSSNCMRTGSGWFCRR